MTHPFSSLTHIFYTHALKPIFFLFNPEPVHEWNVSVGKRLGENWLTKRFIQWMWAGRDSTPVKTLDGISFPGLVGLSAGFDYNADLTQISPALGFGFHTVGTVTLEAYQGNPPPRLGRFPLSRALLVNKGLKNLGAKKIIRKLTQLRFEIPVGISIASTNRKFKSETEQIADITDCFCLFENSAVRHSYYELNISCPNTFGGEPFTSPRRLEKLMKNIDLLNLSKPLYIKMPIDLTKKEILVLLTILAKHFVQGVVFGNLTKDHTNPAVHPDDRRKWLKLKGNLSGKPTWERSNTFVQLTRDKFGQRFTIIGTGGIFSGADAQKKLESGADLVQLITGMIYEGPQLVGDINRHLAKNSLVKTLRHNSTQTALGHARAA